MNQLSKIPESDEKLIKRVKSSLDLYKEMAINNADQAQQAKEIIKEVKSQAKDLTERRLKITRPLDDSKASVMQLFKPALENAEQIEKILKQKLVDYLNYQEKLIQDEAAKKSDTIKNEMVKAETKASELRGKGKEEEAERVIQKAEEKVFATPVPEKAKVTGTSKTAKWRAEVKDFNDFLQLIIDGELPPTVISVKQGELDRVASQWKDNKEFKGLRFYKDHILTVR